MTRGDDDDIPANRSTEPTLENLARIRFGRRGVLRGAAAALLGGVLTAAPMRWLAAARGTPAFTFDEIAHGVDGTHHVPPGYQAQILLRWGDPLFADAPAFNPHRQSAAAQRRQLGYNNDFIGCIGVPGDADNPTRGLLCINHEYTNEEVMFPGLGRQDRGEKFAGMTKALVDTEMAAHGGTIVEIARGRDGWRAIRDSRFNRRITTSHTVMAIAGPAAGHPRLRTGADPTGRRVIGTLNNCAGGMTPWGTWLMAEENFNGYFQGNRDFHPESKKLRRYGAPGHWFAWGDYHERFDIDREANEVNRFGWIAEVDPANPESTPRKRTALGRFKHEGAGLIRNKDGRIAVYCGDDQRFEYLYKFVSAGRHDPDNPESSRDLLDRGVLHVARFDADGGLEWLPLVHGQGPLTKENGFPSQADILIDARLAADALGATPLDRPEDVQPNPVTGKVYVMLTNNTKRKKADRDAVNTRAGNRWGQIVEITPTDGDHAVRTARWDLLVQCGDPADKATRAMWNKATSRNGWFANPDNAAVDGSGRLWIATDQGGGWPRNSGTADGLWALETHGARRGTGRMFFRAPVGAEVTGPCFAPDDRTLFLSVQHPAIDGVKHYDGFERNSTFEDPATRWPDFDPAMPPRPAIVAITKRDGGIIGS